METNQHLFSSKVELPSAVGMGEEEMEEAAKQYARLWSEEESSKLEELEKDDIREPFKFKFSTIEDGCGCFVMRFVTNKDTWHIVNVK